MFLSNVNLTCWLDLDLQYWWFILNIDGFYETKILHYDQKFHYKCEGYYLGLVNQFPS